MRIAMIGQKGIELGEKGGGIEQHVKMLSKHLVLRGHEVTVYARKKYGATKSKGKLKIKFIPTIYRKNLEAIIHTILSTLHAMFVPYDIIHYHGVGPSTISWLPRLLKPKTKVVVTFHSQDRFHKKWGFFARQYLHLGELTACYFPNATIAVSHSIQAYARKHYKHQIIYIPNATEIKKSPGSSELKSFGLTKEKYLLNVSRLIPHKGQRYLIEAFKKIKPKGWKLAIVGAPSYTTKYEDELKELAGKDKDILFTGYQSGKALEQLFANAYLYIQPSESEGLPVVVIEALSFGTAVLVSDIPENLEAIDHAGFSFKNKSSSDLAKKLKDLIEHKEKVEKARKHAKTWVEKEFSWELNAQRTEQVYRTIRH